ncbi:hypothetical protein TH53_10845 [Pedobacter lusitanus]|uniref:Contig44, whole genome shotgun sequence n=1 Tax=Pedobacter lusitanus TaxID=1503925 RepID=A0A0D0FXA3_9SPHI|nr:hypothetical protein [Pedobacter lusitanus]KIO77134.1 hypothetical protein TH53_10845 [Pedobacter lusitanus]
MRIIFYLILFTSIIFSLSSCSKGEVIKDPRFGSVSITDRTNANISVIQGDNYKFPLSGKGSDADQNISLVSGQNRFRFYEEDVLLLDTSISVEAFVLHPYFMFMSNANSVLRIVDAKLNNFDKEEKPDAGFIKISLANFSKFLPDKINVYVSTTTYIPYLNQPIQIGEFLNASGSFSGFKRLLLGKDQASRPVKDFLLTIKDRADQTVLATSTFTLPVETKNVYLLYLSGDNLSSLKVTTLMSK